MNERSRPFVFHPIGSRAWLWLWLEAGTVCASFKIIIKIWAPRVYFGHHQACSGFLAKEIGWMPNIHLQRLAELLNSILWSFLSLTNLVIAKLSLKDLAMLGSLYFQLFRMEFRLWMFTKILDLFQKSDPEKHSSALAFFVFQQEAWPPPPLICKWLQSTALSRKLSKRSQN